MTPKFSLSKRQRGQTLVSLLVAMAIAGIGFAGAISVFSQTISFTTEHKQARRHDQQLLQAFAILEMEIADAGFGITSAQLNFDLVVDTSSGNNRLLWFHDSDRSGTVDCSGIQYLDNELSMLTVNNCDSSLSLTGQTWVIDDVIAEFTETDSKPAPSFTFTTELADCTPYGIGTPTRHAIVNVSAGSSLNAYRTNAGVGSADDGLISMQLCVVNIVE